MEDDKTLFKWSRISEPRSYSRKNNVTQPEDIEKWLERIDTAATRAVVNAAKSESRSKKSRTASSPSAGDSVYGEARQLLSSWLTKKESAALNDGDGFHVAPQGPDRLAIKHEWDRLLGQQGSLLSADEEEQEEMASVTAYSAPLVQLAAGEGLAAAAAAHESEQWDQSESVEAIMKRMLARDYVDKRKLRRMQETVPTPRSDLKTKLELRQERAREVRERRRQLEEQKRQEKALKKEAEAEARKMLLEEERKRALEAKKEEEMIQMEMVRIRKELEARHRAEEEAAAEQARLKKRQESGVRSARSGLTETTMTEAEAEEEAEEERRSLVALQRRKDEILAAMQKGDRRQASRNLKLELFSKKLNNKVLQRCFASWFSIILDRRLQLGRAAAIADWRLLRVSFHAWRDLVRRQRLEAEANTATLLAIREQRNLRVADEFARSLLLRRCFAGWRQFIAQERLWKAQKALEEQKRRKMAAFLKAAATAAAEEPAREERERREREERERKKAAEEEEEERRRLEAERSEETPLPVSPDSQSARSHSSPSPSPARRQKASSAGHTRKTSGGSNNAKETRPQAAPREVSSFEHRFRSQQEALKEQARRLEEQARMIEELRYEQRQAEMRREVADIRAEREKAKRRPAPSSAAAKAEAEAEAEVEAEAESESRSEANSSAHTESSSRASDARSTPNKNPILMRMEQRAAERAKVKAEREEKRKAAEQKKAMEAAAHLEEQQRKEEEEKAARLRELRERRRAEKAAEAERQAATERRRAAEEKAAAFRHNAQLRWRGWQPWRRLLAIRGEQEAQAVLHHKHQLLKRSFSLWRTKLLAKNAAEDQLVREHRNRAILRRCFNSWRLAKFYAEAMELKAQNFFDLILQRRCFRAWTTMVREQTLKRWELESAAKKFHSECLLRRVLAAWRQLPALQAEEAAREQRRAAIRRRVQTLVPDFRPPSPPDSPLFDAL